MNYICVLRTYFVAGGLILLLATSALAQDNQVKVPFLFSEDEKLDQIDIINAIPKSSDLQGARYLNAPITRLEYMLTRVEAKLNSEESREIVRSRLSNAFESPEIPNLISIDGFARYTPENGRIVVGYTIKGLGRPNKPMRASCDALMLMPLSIEAPQENIGYLLHNTVLGVLMQKDATTYTPVMETFARNTIHRVNLISTNEDSGVMFGLSCQRTKKGAPIQYNRFSAKLY